MIKAEGSANKEIAAQLRISESAVKAALQVLYQWEVGRNDVAQAAALFFEQQWPGDAPAPGDLRQLAWPPNSPGLASRAPATRRFSRENHKQAPGIAASRLI